MSLSNGKNLWNLAFANVNEEAKKTKTNRESERAQANRETEKAKKNKLNEERKQRNEDANREQNEQLQRNIKCMNQYRNNQGKLQLPEQFKSLTDDKIYYYFGHGSTICDEYGTPVIKVVPDNCIYISQTVCGLINVGNTKLTEAFLNEEYAHIWRDPIANLHIIKEIIGNFTKDIAGIHIHLPGCTYIDTHYFPLGHDDLKELTYQEGHKIGFSGIMSLKDAHTVERANNPYIEGIEFESKDLLDIDQVRGSFKYSFFPKVKTTDQIILPKDLEDTIYFYEREGKVNINDLIVQSGMISNKVPMSKLMEKYPGIHFNLLCRSIVDKSCLKEGKRAITRRRRHSAIVQNTLSNTVDKILKMRTLFPTHTKGAANDNALYDYLVSITDKITNDTNLNSLYDIYSSIRHFGSPKSEAYVYSLFKELFMKQFNDLFEKLQTTTNPEEINDLQKQIGNLIRRLKMNALQGVQTHYYKLELEILGEIAYSAILKNDKNLFDYVAELGAVNDTLRSLIKNNNYNNWLKAGQTIFNKAYNKEKLKENSNNNTNKSTTSQDGGRKRKDRRKTLKKRSA